jgi:DNA-binding MarR family transcriptional regulator
MPAQTSVAEAERSLEGLFRLSSSRRMYVRQTAAVGVPVSRAGYALLRSLEEAEQLTSSELATYCSMDLAATGRQIATLEAEGLVIRSPSSIDGRVSVVRITEAGRRVYSAIAALRVSHLERVLADWSEPDRQRLSELVDRLVHDLQTAPLPLATES